MVSASGEEIAKVVVHRDVAAGQRVRLARRQAEDELARALGGDLEPLGELPEHLGLNRGLRRAVGRLGVQRALGEADPQEARVDRKCRYAAPASLDGEVLGER